MASKREREPEPEPKPVREPQWWGLLCPLCHAEAALTIDLNDLRVIECGECAESFTVRQAVEKTTEQLRRWQAVERWLSLADVDLTATASAEA